MRARLLALLLLVASVGAGWWLLSHPPRSRNPLPRINELSALPQISPAHLVASSNLVLAAAPELPSTDSGTRARTEGAATSAPTVLAASSEGLTPTAVLDQMRTAIHLYASVLGQNPVGANFEITRALNGGNPRHVNFIPPDAGLRLNSRGELVDAWGTPFFFHQLSGTQMEIRSAGPDRILWTGDDLVVR